jgi:hypothetical protein
MTSSSLIMSSVTIPAKNARTQAKRHKAEKRKRITELRKKQVSGIRQN